MSCPHAVARERDHQDRVGGGHAHAHHGAGQRRHVQRGVGQQQDPADAGQRSRQRRDDDEGIEPRLEVHHDQEVDQHDRHQQSDAEADERAAHGLDLAAHDELRAARQVLPEGLQHFVDVAATPPRSRSCVLA